MLARGDFSYDLIYTTGFEKKIHRRVRSIPGSVPQSSFAIMVSSSPLCASSAAVASSAASISCKNASSDVLCRFGVIADVQYADKDDAYNFAKTKVRWVRAFSVKEWYSPSQTLSQIGRDSCSGSRLVELLTVGEPFL